MRENSLRIGKNFIRKASKKRIPITELETIAQDPENDPDR